MEAAVVSYSKSLRSLQKDSYIITIINLFSYIVSAEVTNGSQPQVKVLMAMSCSVVIYNSYCRVQNDVIGSLMDINHK